MLLESFEIAEVATCCRKWFQSENLYSAVENFFFFKKKKRKPVAGNQPEVKSNKE